MREREREREREGKRTRVDCMCVQIPAGVRVHGSFDRYSQYKAYTLLVKGYVKSYLVSCGLDGQVSKLMLSTWKCL